MERHGRTAGLKIAGLLALVALGACAQEPDFGRARPALIERVDAAFVSGTANEPALPMTAAESELRGIAANLCIGRPLAENDHLFGLTKLLDGGRPPTTPSLGYYERLRARMPASGEALVDAIAADVDADTAAMERFAAISQTVVDADDARAQDLRPPPSHDAAAAYDGPGAFAKARARIAENGRIIDDTGNTLAARLVAYRTALGQVRLDAPVAERIRVLEAAIGRMGEQLALMDRNALAHAVVVNDLKSGPSKS